MSRRLEYVWSIVCITTQSTYQQAQPEASAPKQGFQYTVRLGFQHKQWHPDFFQFVVPLYVFWNLPISSEGSTRRNRDVKKSHDSTSAVVGPKLHFDRAFDWSFCGLLSAQEHLA
jgi:hypothetical protein